MSSSEQIEQTSPPPFKKRKRKLPWKTRLKTIWYWLITHPLDMMIVVMMLTAVTLYINPFPAIDITMEDIPVSLRGFASNLGNWVAYDGGSSIGGGLFFVLAAALTVIRGRQFAIERQAWWSNQCPNCKSQFTLRRIRRTKGDKAIALLQIPIRRYACNNCEWRGRRVDEDNI